MSTQRGLRFLLAIVCWWPLAFDIEAQAQGFYDNFEDGSATDGTPATWAPVPGYSGSFLVRDGDYVLTRPSGSEEMYAVVSPGTFADTSVRTQARLSGSNASWFGVFARVDLAIPTAYIALLRSNGSLEIWLFGPSSPKLASASVGIDPRSQDVRLRFDVIGSELSAWAWREEDSMPTAPQVTVLHRALSSGIVGVAGDLGTRLSNSEAIFRYVDVTVPGLSSPTDITLSNLTVVENQPSGAAVGTFSTTDPDAGNTFTYTLVNGSGSTDNGAFTISGSTLYTAASFNYEGKSNYSVRIRTTDQGGLWFEKLFTVQVTDVAEPPFEITEFGVEFTTGIVIRWTCEAGYTYQLRYAETLAADDWHDIGPAYVANDGETSMSFTDTGASAAVDRFYVVVRAPLE